CRIPFQSQGLAENPRFFKDDIVDDRLSIDKMNSNRLSFLSPKNWIPGALQVKVAQHCGPQGIFSVVGWFLFPFPVVQNLTNSIGRKGNAQENKNQQA